MTKVKNGKKILTMGSYYELNSFSKYLLSFWAITLVEAPTIISAFTYLYDMTSSWKLCTGNFILWVLLKVLEHRFCGIWCFISFPQINGPKYLLSTEEKSLKTLIIHEKCKSRKRTHHCIKQLTTGLSKFPGIVFKELRLFFFQVFSSVETAQSLHQRKDPSVPTNTRAALLAI